MGYTGPCGSCSKIHYNCIGNRDASALVNEEDPGVIKTWTLVFIQFNCALASFPAQHVDMGMGLERIFNLLQNKSSNYIIDAFLPLFDAIDKLGNVGACEAEDVALKDTIYYYVVVDHARTLTFALAYGWMWTLDPITRRLKRSPRLCRN